MAIVLNFKSVKVAFFLALVSFWDASISLAEQPGPSKESTQKIKSHQEHFKNEPTTIEAVFRLAQEYLKNNESGKATKLLWNYIDKMPRKGLILLAQIHEQRNEPLEMLKALNILVGKNERDFEAHSLMGNAYIQLKKNAESIEHYKLSIEINKKYEPAYKSLITMYEKRVPPNFYELRILFQDMVEAFGPKAEYLRKICEIDTLDGTFESAIQTCKDAIKKDPQSADPYVYLAVSYKGIGEDKLAASKLKQAAHDFTKSEVAQFQYAKYLEDEKNYIEAFKLFQKGTEADSLSARSWLGLATTAFEVKKYDISLDAFKKACKLDKKNASAFRRATSTLKNQKVGDWSDKFDNASISCNI